MPFPTHRPGLVLLAVLSTSLVASARLTFQEQVITSNLPEAHFVQAVDIDGDGDMDVVGVGRLYENDAPQANGALSVFLNDGNPDISWTEQIVTSTALQAHSAFAADMDGDGDVDIVLASLGDDRVYVYLNGGETGGAPITWTEQVIGTSADAYWVYAADVDSDGDMDVVLAARGANVVSVFFNGGQTGPAAIVWTEQVLGIQSEPQSVFVADVDGDGDMDVVAASKSDDTVAVYLNGGQTGGTPIEWVRQDISTTVGGAHSVSVSDLDGDGDLDVVAAAFTGDEVVAFYNGGETGGAAITWSSQTLESGLPGVIDVYTADVDGDGDMDVLAAVLLDDVVMVYWNGGQSDDGTIVWTARIVTANARRARVVSAADVNGDGSTDVLAASSGTNSLAVYFAPVPSSSPTPTASVRLCCPGLPTALRQAGTRRVRTACKMLCQAFHRPHNFIFSCTRCAWCNRARHDCSHATA